MRSRMAPLAPDEVLALSVHPQWAAMIASGLKSLETRTWRTHYRGPLLICSGKQERGRGKGQRHRRCVLPAGGVTVCLVELVNVRPMHPGDAAAACTPFNPKLFVWELADVRPVKPVPVRGRLGLFRVQRTSVVSIDPARQIGA